MPQYDLNIQAGFKAKQATAGLFFMVLDDGGAALDVQLQKGGAVVEELRAQARGLKLRPSGGFDSVFITASIAATVRIVISDGLTDIDILGTSTHPMLVSNDRGSVAQPMNVTGVTINDAPATSITAPAAVATSQVAAQLVAANANRRTVRFANLGANAVAIGPAGITWATRCIVLNPGDTWVEERAGVLAWFGICNAGLASSIGVQEVLA